MLRIYYYYVIAIQRVMIESWELVEQDDMHDIAFAINFFTKHVFGINFNSVFWEQNIILN